jgi:hypothetical protein
MPWVEVTFDRGFIGAEAPPDGFGQIGWTPVLYDECTAVPPPAEELAFHDVDVFSFEGMSWAVARHGMYGGYADGCNEYAPPSTASLIPLELFDVAEDEIPWVTLGDDVLSVSITPRAEALAMIRPFACIDTLADCPPFSLTVMAPPLGALDPTVSTWSVPLGDLTTTTARAAALEPRFGALGAVAVVQDLLGTASVTLVDGIDTAAPITLATAPFAIAERPRDDGVHALRRQRRAQRAQRPPNPTATPDNVAEGALVRFGCPFPSFPSVVAP